MSQLGELYARNDASEAKLPQLQRDLRAVRDQIARTPVWQQADLQAKETALLQEIHALHFEDTRLEICELENDAKRAILELSLLDEEIAQLEGWPKTPRVVEDLTNATRRREGLQRRVDRIGVPR